MIEKILIAVLLTTTILFGGLYFSSNNLGATSGTEHYFAEVFNDNITLKGSSNTISTSTFSGSIAANSSTTIKCLSIYPSSSIATAYYVYVDSATTTRGSGGSFILLATTTKGATVCP